MKEFVIGTNEEGKRFDHFLRTVMPLAGDSFIYKMLRKKNIKLNDKKASGRERLKENDIVRIYLKDETFNLFASNNSVDLINSYNLAYKNLKGIKVVFENEDIVILYKPSDVLSQKAGKNDISINEWFVGYLLQLGYVNQDSLRTFRPSVLNRLDRNTKGLIIGAKNLNASREISELIKERRVKKYYFTTVKGHFEKDILLEGYLYKDESQNKVTVYDQKPEGIDTEAIKTYVKVLKYYEDRTDLEVELITGKSHQIRAHLSSIGHPILGDPKYGDRDFNLKYQKREQELVAYKLVFPEDTTISSIKGRTVMLNGYVEESRP